MPSKQNVMTCQAMVQEFHETFGQRVGGQPELKDAGFRLRLIREEYIELVGALANRDIVGTADALADLAYVIYGAAITFGIDLDAVLAEVHRSNMAKVWPDGEVVKREDGKVLKPEGWTPPDIAGVLGVEA